MKRTTEPTLSAAIGTRIRELREANGATQDDVARAAGEIGLRWTRATVAALELGRRALSPEELLLLPRVLANVDVTVELHELLPRDIVVSMSPETRVTTRALEATLKGYAREIEAWEWDTPGNRRFGLTVDQRAKLSSTLEPEEWNRIRKHLKLEPLTPEAAMLAVRRSRRDAEQKAAWKLRVPAFAILLAAEKLWGRSLSEERERRVRLRVDEDAGRRGLQAVRGHVTRELLEELRPLVEGIALSSDDMPEASPRPAAKQRKERSRS